ncbi:hypothetical protein KQI86_19805 [Clostridium sp. MSJ-11]|uniref:SipL SPOCS domain-containing protein n=1 Tax=Clostridium mobile TaxID=2841512 RepID=A0ABS6EPE5_9CLOT|nr:hypothetical protein [Clostridium mobile]MBU5486536.1 hypothetical protein [Clostridium mobile]
MKVNDIEISGVISQDDLNYYNLHYPRKEICETYGITFLEDNPSIETPLQIFFDTKVVENKIIYTQGENKIFLHGIITTKLVYVADEGSKPINTIEFYKHFSCILPTNAHSSESITTKVFIEDAIVTQESSRGFYVSLVLLVGPIDTSDVNKDKEVEILPKREKLNKIEEPENISIPVKNSDADIEIQYDMNTQQQYFESNWK